jgi:hypothetical protein
MALTISRRPDFVFQSQRQLAGTRTKVYTACIESTIPEVVGEAAADHPARSVGFVHF